LSNTNIKVVPMMIMRLPNLTTLSIDSSVDLNPIIKQFLNKNQIQKNIFI
jgi:hypothetical protein